MATDGDRARRAAAAWARPGGTIVVASDLHLGPAPEPAAEALAHWLPTLAQDRPKATLLALDGDLVDLTLAEVCPPDRAAGRRRTEVRRQPAAAALARLHAILDANAPAFDALAGFVRSGGSIAFIVGNHDLELDDEAVQHALLARLAGRSAAARGRISFGESLYVPGVLYAEHGHRLHDIAAAPGGRLPLTTQLEALLGGVQRSRGVGGRIGALRRVARPALDALASAARRPPPSLAPEGPRLATVLPPEAAAALEPTTARVGPSTFLRIAAVLAARPARVVGPVALPALAGSVVFAAAGRRSAAATVALAGSAAAAIAAVRGRRRLWPPPRSTAYLRTGIARVDARLRERGLDVPVYVLGHSHVAEIGAIHGRPAATYANAGAWVDPADGFPYVRVTVAGGVRVTLERAGPGADPADQPAVERDAGFGSTRG